MEELFLPVLSHFQNENIWIASEGRMRYRVTPTKTQSEDGGEEPVLRAEVWEGPWELSFSQVEDTADFPMSDEGIASMGVWLTEASAGINARPARSLAENLARRDAVIQAQKDAEAAKQAEGEKA